MTESEMAGVDEDIAQQVGAGMYERDYAAQRLGIRLVAIGPGAAVMTMRVSEDMVNGHDICHGGFTFALADTCFAYACNSYNKVAVARQCEISFLKAARAGDLLTAAGREVHRTSRNGIYDITVTDEAGEVVALMRGHSRTLDGEVITGVTVVA